MFVLRQNGGVLVGAGLFDQGLLFRLNQPEPITFEKGIGYAGAESSAVSQGLILNLSQH